MRVRRLFLCEKPSVARQIAPRLGSVSSKAGYLYVSNGDVVTWTAGHAYENAPAVFYDKDFKPWAREKLPLIPRFVILPKKEMCQQLAIIKDLLSKAETVISVGDPDREGNLLIDEILEEMKWKGPTKRILIQGNDSKSLDAAIADIKDNREFATWTQAARLRSHIDWIAGINHTVALTVFARSLGIDTLMTVGRVQTPLLNLIVSRKREIQNFKPTAYLALQAIMSLDTGQFSTTLMVDKNAAGIDSEGRIVCKSYAASIIKACEGQSGEVTAVDRKKQKGDPPLPLCLSTLQAMANKKFGLEPDATLSIVQKLYDDGFTTYPRTGCSYIPEGQFPEAQDIIALLAACNENDLQKIAGNANPGLKSKAFDDSKVEAHFALIPTCQKPDFSKMEGRASEIYKLIATYYLLQFYPPEEYETQNVLVSVNGFTWKAHGRVSLNAGWKKTYKDTGEEEKNGQGLPEVQKGQAVTCLDVKAEEKQTSPPSYFTPGTIIEAMKEAHKFVTDPKMRATLRGIEGVGTEATRASIYKSLKTRGYIDVKGNKILPTALGEQLIDLVPPGMKDIGMTALLENKLEEVFKGNLEPEPIFKQYAESLKPAIDTLFSSKPTLSVAIRICPCPNCGSNLRKVKSRKNGKLYWICAAEGCGYIVGDDKGKPGKPQPKTEIFPEFSCPNCGKPLAKHEGKFGWWWGCSGYKDGCKFTAPDDNGKPGAPRERLQAKGDFKCPECGKSLKFVEGKDKRRWHICENAQKHKRKKANFFPDNDGEPDFN